MFEYGKEIFESKNDLYKFLIENKSTLKAQKQAEMKKATAISFCPQIVNEKGETNKANEPFDASALDSFKVRVIINTTNLMDSHNDVHIKGLWKKSLQENKNIMHLQEHVMAYEKIISDGKELKAFTKNYSWVELGMPFEGNTQALVFDSKILKSRNPFMFNQYANGWVKNHSVGMRYIKYDLAVNDENYVNEFEAWNKYYPEIANKEKADEKGYFWYVLEAKVIEGSAVPLGSNWVTPTQNNNLKNQPLKNTDKQNNEPSIADTQKKFYESLLKN